MVEQPLQLGNRPNAVPNRRRLRGPFSSHFACRGDTGIPQESLRGVRVRGTLRERTGRSSRSDCAWLSSMRIRPGAGMLSRHRHDRLPLFNM
jgi:hypothetical protein